MAGEQQDTGTTTPEGTPAGDSTTGTADSGTPAPQENGTDERDALKTTLEKEREAARTARAELKRLQADLEKYKGTETERDEYKSKYEGLIRQQELATFDTELKSVAEKEGAISPAYLAKVLRDEVQKDKDGKTNVAQLIKDHKKEFPELFRSSQGSGNGGATRTGGEKVGSDWNSELRAALWG